MNLMLIHNNGTSAVTVRAEGFPDDGHAIDGWVTKRLAPAETVRAFVDHDHRIEITG